MGLFSLHRRSQHAAASADSSGNVVVYDLYLAFEDESQARHYVLMDDPTSASRLSGELGSAVSKDKLDLAKHGPAIIAPGAVGNKESGKSVSADHTTTRIELIDSGSVEIVSDQEDAKIFMFGGSKLAGRATFIRDGSTKKFSISTSAPAGTGDSVVTGGGGDGEQTKSDNGGHEDSSMDPKLSDIDDFVSPEFDEVIRVMAEDRNASPDIAERLRAIRARLSDKKLTARDVVFVLRLISGGEEAARKAQKENDDVVSLWDDSEWNDDKLICLDSSSGRKEYEIVKSPDGTYEIPRFQFIKTGIFNGENFSTDKVRKIISNTNMLADAKYMDVPVKIGHHKEQSLRGDKGELALGWVSKAWEEGVGDGFLHIKGMPRALAFLVSKGALKHRSAEIFRDVEFNGTKIGPSLKAISLLGTSTPAVLGMQGAATLDSAVQMYSDEIKDFIVVNIRSDAMPDMIQLSKEELDKKIAEGADSAAKRAADQLKLVYEKDNADLKAQVTLLSQNLDTERTQRRKDRVKLDREHNVLQFEALVRDGNILPVQKDEYIALCNVLDGVTDMARGHDLSEMLDGVKGDKNTMEFSIAVQDEDKKVDVVGTPKGLLLRLLKGQKQINLGIESTDLTDEAKKKIEAETKKRASDAGSNAKKVDELAKKLQKDNKVSYADALELAVDQIFGDKARDMVNTEGL